MNLREYLFYSGLTINEFAQIIDLSGAYLGEVIRGRQKPSKKVLRSIERASGGAVTQESALKPMQIPEPIRNLVKCA